MATEPRYPQRVNSTDYEHPQERHLLDLHYAMQYRSDGSPELRVNSAIEGNVIIEGNVNIPGEIEIANDSGNPIPISATKDTNNAENPIYVSSNITGGNVTVAQGTTPWTITGNVVTIPAAGASDYYGAAFSIPLIPYIQINSYEGIKERETQIYTASGGTVEETDVDIAVSCTNTVGSYGVYRSRKFIPYRSGQSSLARSLVQFGTAQPGTDQRIGISNQESSYYVGFNGTAFQFLHSFGGRAEIWSLTVNNTATTNQTITVTLAGTSYNVPVLSGDTAIIIANKICSTINAIGWLCTTVNNVVNFLASALGPKSGTFSVTSTGNVTGSLVKQSSGVAATDEWLDLDAVPSWFDPTQYTLYQFHYTWAGVEVSILNPDLNQMFRIKNHGLQDDGTLPVRKPAFKVTAVCYNTGGSTGTTLNVSFLMGAVAGEESVTNYTYGGATTKSSLSSDTFHHIMSIQNPYVTQEYKLNFRQLRFLNLTAAVQCNDPVEFFIVFDSKLDNGTQFQWVNVDGRIFNASTATGTINVDIVDNTPIIALVAGISGSGTEFNLADYHLVLPPGDHVSLVAYSQSTIQKISIAGVWATVG